MYRVFSRIRDGLILSLFIFAAFAHGGEGEASSDLAAELAEVRTSIKELHTEIIEAAKDLHQAKHDLEYTDPVCAALHAEIKALEKEILEKREVLDARLDVVPEYREVLGKRAALFRKLEELKAEEQGILREMKTAELQEPSSEE